MRSSLGYHLIRGNVEKMENFHRRETHALRDQTWSFNPAAIAGVHGHHCLAEPCPLVAHRLSQGLPQTRVRQHAIVVNMGQRQRLPQARLTLAQRAGTPSNRRDVLTKTAVAALHQGSVDGPTQRTPYLIDGLNCTKD